MERCLSSVPVDRHRSRRSLPNVIPLEESRSTLVMNYDAQPDALDCDLVYKFFWQFSVFECALKREGFLKNRKDGSALPDWDKFAKEISGGFDGALPRDFQQAILVLTTATPRKQVVVNDRLAWQDNKRGDGETFEAFVLRMVRTVRNNLFHGGKYPDGPVEEVARDRDLLRAGCRVLEECVKLHKGLARWVQT